MLKDIIIKEDEELLSTPIVQQTAFWSVVKNKLGESTMAMNFKLAVSSAVDELQERAVVSDVLVTIKHIDKYHSIAYVPYGPELEPDEESQGPFLEELSESMRSFLPAGCLMIRYDLCWESYWAKEADNYLPDGTWTGEPETAFQELRFNFNTVKGNFRKTGFNLLPSHTVFVNLKKDTDSILAGMKPKTRYNINLALRKGVEVRTMGMENLNIWYELYKETASRNKIYLNNIKFFEAVLSARADNSRSPAQVVLLVAEFRSEPLAAMFLIISSNRGSYLYGASSSKHRNLMATYALQWEAIKISKELGCTEYDMFGVSPGPDPSHPMYGLYRFKTGFGGHIYHRMGSWDYPIDKENYNILRSIEMNSQGFHIN